MALSFNQWNLFVFYIFSFIVGSYTQVLGNVTVIDETIGNDLDVPIPSTAPSKVPSTTRRPLLQSMRLPCSCFEGQCGCCTGYILDRLNQKVCMNMTADPEDFSVSAAMYLNGKIWYRNTVSGKNPPPMCIRLPRFRFIKFCVEFSNIYLADRNIHLCIDAEANWEDLTLLEWSFDCVRMGLSGVAVVRPEDGGGLPGSPIDTVDQTDEDYDDSARDFEQKSRKIILHRSISRIQDKSPDRRLVNVVKLKNGDYLLKYAGRHN